MMLDTKLDIRPITPTIGAEIHGLDLARHLDAEIVAAIRAAWLEHLVLFFPEQELGPDHQVAFAEQLGEVTAAHPVEPALDGHPEVLPVDSLKDRVDFWHTDVTFMARPPMGSILYASVLPLVGGDTMWADLRAAYDTLAPPLQELCDGLVAYHFDPSYAQLVEQGSGQVWEGKRIERLLPVEHPVVRVHPETGRKNLFVNPQFTVAIKGFPGLQSQALLGLLHEHTLQHERICRYHWHPGTLALWDNRATMHYALYDYGNQRRIMHRVTLRGDRPEGTERMRAQKIAS